MRQLLTLAGFRRVLTYTSPPHPPKILLMKLLFTCFPTTISVITQFMVIWADLWTDSSQSLGHEWAIICTTLQNLKLSEKLQAKGDPPKTATCTPTQVPYYDFGATPYQIFKDGLPLPSTCISSSSETISPSSSSSLSRSWFLSLLSSDSLLDIDFTDWISSSWTAAGSTAHTNVVHVYEGIISHQKLQES